MIQTFGPEFLSLDEAFLAAMKALLQQGDQRAPRALPTRELAPFSFTITDPRRRYISVSERRWSIVYAIAELVWHLRGSDSTDEVAFYAPRWRHIANGSPTIIGSSYGAKMFRRTDGRPSQWDRALAVLRQDKDSRRAVIHLSSPDLDLLDPGSDIACAMTLQLLLRDGRLDAICTMRSNDVVLGLPYDVFLFTMVQEIAAMELGCDLGRYHHQVGSLHLYESQLALAQRVAAARSQVSAPMRRMGAVGGIDELLDGEARSRLGEGPRSQMTTTSNDYWSDLLKVIEGGNGVRNGAGPTALPIFQDPVLDALFEQWRSAERTPPWRRDHA